MLVFLAACAGPAPTPGARVSIAAPTQSTPPSAPSASTSAPPPLPTWPAKVDRTLPAPNGFHLLATRDHEALVVASAEVELGESESGRSRTSTDYYARLDLGAGCIEETHVFPIYEDALANATVKRTPTFAAELGAVRDLSKAFGPAAAPFPFEPDGSLGFLQVGGALLSVRPDATTQVRARGVTSYVTLSADGAYVLFGSTGSSALAILDVATMRARPVVGSARRLLHAYASGDSFLAVETDDLAATHPTRSICVTRVEPKTAREKTGVCVSAKPTSEVASAMSPDGRYLAMVVEHPPAPAQIVAFDTSSWQEVTHVAGGLPTYVDVDSHGRVAWSYDSGNFVGEGSARKTVVAPNGPNGIAPRVIGFVGSDIVVAYPPMEIAGPGRIAPLGELSPCGYAKVVRAP